MPEQSTNQSISEVTAEGVNKQLFLVGKNDTQVANVKDKTHSQAEHRALCLYGLKKFKQVLIRKVYGSIWNIQTVYNETSSWNLEIT